MASIYIPGISATGSLAPGLTPSVVRAALELLSSSEIAAGYQPLDGDLTSLAGASSTNAIYYRSAANTWSPVTIGANLTFSGGTLAATGGGGGTPGGTSGQLQYNNAGAFGGFANWDGTTLAITGNETVSGNFGIGGTPSWKMHFQQSSSTTTKTGDIGSEVVLENPIVSSAGPMTGIRFVTPVSSLSGKASGRVLSGFSSNGYSFSYITFQTVSGSNVFVDALTLQGGNLAAGQPTAAVRLDVAGTSLATGSVGTEDEFQICRLLNPGPSYPQTLRFALGRYTATGAPLPKTRVDVKLCDASTSATPTTDMTLMTWQANGAVLIGTTTDDGVNKLQVNGGVCGTTLKLGSFTVGTLPSVGSNAGAFADVSDALNGDIGLPVVSGGSAQATVRSNGTSWIVTAVIKSDTSLTDGATISLNANLNHTFEVTLGGNRTLSNPTGGYDGQGITIRVRQDATGGRTLAFGTNYRFGTDIPSITLSTGANKVDYIGLRYDASATKWDVVSFSPGFN